MFEDFVHYGDDLERIKATAERLGFSKLNIVAGAKDINGVTKMTEGPSTDLSLEIFLAVENRKDADLARRKGLRTIFIYGGDQDIRSAITEIRPDIITNLEYQKRDFMHHRSSGLNQVTAKLLAENGIAVGINIGFLKSTKYKGEVMGRMSQNIALCKKYGVSLKAFSLARSWNGMSSPKDMISLLRVLGTDQKIAKKALQKTSL